MRILLVIISWAALSAGTFKVGSQAARVRIAGFWPDYRGLDHLNYSVPLLSDLILFSLELNEDGTVGHIDGGSSCCLRPEHYERSRTTKETFGSALEVPVELIIGNKFVPIPSNVLDSLTLLRIYGMFC